MLQATKLIKFFFKKKNQIRYPEFPFYFHTQIKNVIAKNNASFLTYW